MDERRERPDVVSQFFGLVVMGSDLGWRIFEQSPNTWGGRIPEARAESEGQEFNSGDPAG